MSLTSFMNGHPKLKKLKAGRTLTLTTTGLSLVSNECCRGLLSAERELPPPPAALLPPLRPVEAAELLPPLRPVEAAEPPPQAASTLSVDPVRSSEPTDAVIESRFFKLFSSFRSHLESSSDWSCCCRSRVSRIRCSSSIWRAFSDPSQLNPNSSSDWKFDKKRAN